MFGLDWMTIVFLAGGGWMLFRKLFPSKAAKVEKRWKQFRPAFEWVEALKASGLIPKNQATSYFVQALEAAGFAREAIDDALQAAEVWSKGQMRADRTALRAIGQRAKLPQAAALVADVKRQMATLDKRAASIQSNLKRLKSIADAVANDEQSASERRVTEMLELRRGGGQ
jgi:hypothetical protein